MGGEEMNKYYMNDEERRGYENYGLCNHARYDGGYDYRKGWDYKDDELRQERFREELRQEELRMRREHQQDQEELESHQECELRRGDLEK